MIWSAALPGAALRVLRTAAGRRALHVALLVGGLCVLGLLCGGRAHAADEEPGSLKDAVGRVLDVSAQTRSRPPAGGSARAAEAVPGPGSGALLPDLRPVTENLVRTVDDQVVRPAGDAVATVVTVVEGAAGLPGPSGPAGPTDPSGPVDVPDLIDLSGLSDVPDPGGQSESSGGARPAVPDPPADPAPTVTDTSRSADPSDASDASDAADTPVAGGAGTPAGVVGYGPESGVGAVPDAHPRTHRAAGSAHTEYAPTHPAPHGDPDGTLGTASGADQGTPRHGDTRAVAPQYRFTFRLVPGAAERSDAAGVREPYRDIPVSPA
ncbi:hypothetical protein [Streptomyces tendae]|uniref:hypothetical protein n=1 Tax=Streptomyces tendae TaxID=1932 RepID=UPI00371816EB